MKLRVRLIVAFFFLSVVPLAAVTLYTYTSNLVTMRDAASHEAEMLAGELSQRMEIVTARLSESVVENYMPASDAEPATSTGTKPSATEAAAHSAESSPKAASLDLAMLINNVEVRGNRGGRGRGGPRPDGFPGGNGRGRPAPGAPPVPGSPTAAGPAVTGAPGALASSPGATPNATTATGSPSTGSGGSTSAIASDTGRSGASPRGFGGGRPRDNPFRGGPDGRGPDGRGPTDLAAAQAPTAPPGGPRIGAPGTPAPPPADANADDPTRIRIDLGPIRDEVLRQLVPDGRLNQLSPEERNRVFGELAQRLIGINQGIQMLREKVAERVTDAESQASAPSSGASSQATSKTATPKSATSKAATPTPKAAVGTTPVPATTTPVAPVGGAQTTRRKTEITGNRMAVRVEQDGQVVGQANAEFNMPNLLATVFTTTRRERGEVPFAVAKDGHLYTQTDADRTIVEGLQTTAAKPETAPGTIVLPEWIVVTTTDPTGSGLKFGIARPVGDALSDLQRATARNAGLGLGFIFLALIGIVPLSSRLTKNLSSLSEGVRRIAQGEYHARVDVQANDEVGRLAKAFNQMAADVELHQRSAVEQERLRRELELGRQIQHDMLPHVPLRLGLTEIKGVSVPAREVGGDFFNYFELANGTIALLVGDVSGKGVGAALLMMNIQASLRTRLALGQDLAALASELDSDIEGSTPGPVYATLFVGILDPVSRILRCVNAGHNPQYVLRQRGGLERMESSGLPIGLISGHGYTEQRVQLAAGDLLFFYTDGCVEAENEDGEEFGPERLEEALARVVGSSADQLLVALERSVSQFRAGKELGDDATMMVVKVG